MLNARTNSRAEIMAARIGVIELRLLLSPALTQGDCALVMEMAYLARRAIDVDPPEPTEAQSAPAAEALA